PDADEAIPKRFVVHRVDPKRHAATLELAHVLGFGELVMADDRVRAGTPRRSDVRLGARARIGADPLAREEAGRDSGEDALHVLDRLRLEALHEDLVLHAELLDDF